MITELTEALPRSDTGEAPRLASAEDGAGRPRFGFIGMGHSGDGELSTRYKDYRRAATVAKTSDDV